MASKLKADEVRLYLSDYASSNLLLDDQEFSDPFIELSMSLAVDEFNSISPQSSYSTENFVSKSLLLKGTLWQMFLGRAALAARNTMQYSDGGLMIPIEEKYELYRNLADTFGSEFKEISAKLKANMNMEAGWGRVSSDERTFPLW